MLRTFNCGIGLVLVAAQADAEEVLSVLEPPARRPIAIGEIEPGRGVKSPAKGKGEAEAVRYSGAAGVCPMTDMLTSISSLADCSPTLPQRLPSPLRGGVGGGGVSARARLSVLLEIAARCLYRTSRVFTPPLTPPRQGEGNPGGACGNGVSHIGRARA